MTVLGYSSRYRSSQPMDSASRWLVGSSSSSMSGADSSSRHSAMRRFSPPDSFSTRASQGGRRSASAAISSLRSSSQPPTASMASCSFACSSSRAFISSSDRGSAKRSLISLKRATWRNDSPTPSMTTLRTVLVGSSSGSWDRYPTRMPLCGRASPSMFWSMPAMILSKVDLPEPFRPRTPILAPGKNDRLMSRRMMRLGGTTLDTRFMV